MALRLPKTRWRRRVWSNKSQSYSQRQRTKGSCCCYDTDCTHEWEARKRQKREPSGQAGLTDRAQEVEVSEVTEWVWEASVGSSLEPGKLQAPCTAPAPQEAEQSIHHATVASPWLSRTLTLTLRVYKSCLNLNAPSVGWRDDSVVKNTSCCSKGLDWIPSTHMKAHDCDSSPKWPNILFQPPRALHVCGSQTYIQARYPHT